MNKSKKSVHLLASIILAGLIAVIVLVWLQGKEEQENIVLISHQDNSDQKSTFKSNKIVNDESVNIAHLRLDKDNELDATTNKFIDQSTTEVVQESEALIKYPVHEGRKTLMDKIRAESFEECFINTADTYGLCMMIPSYGGFFFSPGFYSSDVMMIKSMDRMRKLVESVKQSPNE